MTRIFSISICLFCITAACNTAEKKEPEPLTREEIITIINEIIISDSLQFPSVCATLSAMPLGSVDTAFTSTDTLFAREQYNKHKDIFLKQGEINFIDKREQKLRLVTVDTLCESLAYRYIPLIQISFPVISPDRKKVAISFTDTCTGLCGWGRTLLYENLNGRWVETNCYEFWIA